MKSAKHLRPAVLAAVIIPGVSMMAGTSMAVTAPAKAAEANSNRDLISRGMAAWANGTGSPYDLLADDAKWTITGNSVAAGTYPSKEAFLRDVIRPFNARMRSPLVPTVRKLYAEDDTVVAFFDAVGMARDGRPYRNTYAWILRMDAGRIVEAHAFFDSIAFDDLWRRVDSNRPTLKQ